MNPEILDMNIILRQLAFRESLESKLSDSLIVNRSFSINGNYNLHIFPKYSLLLNNGISYMKINSIASKILVKINDGYSVEDLFHEFKIDSRYIINFIKILLKYKILENNISHSEIKITGDFVTYFPLHCSIEITSKCNLKCKHCYVAAQCLDYNEIDFHILKELLTIYKGKVETITFTGGDPLCHPDIKKILKYAKNCGFKVRLNTSGYLLDEEMIKFLKEIDINNIKLSLDGEKPSTHNYLRNSDLAFAKVINCMKILNKYDISFSLGTVIGDFNINEMEGIIKLAKTYNAQKIGIGTILPIGRANKNNHKIFISDYNIFLEKIDLLLRKYNDFVSFDEDGNWCEFIREGQFDLTSYINYKNYVREMSCDGCGAGSKILFIDSLGNIKPCMMSNIILGNISSTHDVIKENINTLLKISNPNEKTCLSCKNYIKCFNCIAKGNLYNKEIVECYWIRENYNLLTKFKKGN